MPQLQGLSSGCTPHVPREVLFLQDRTLPGGFCGVCSLASLPTLRLWVLNVILYSPIKFFGKDYST